jgi:hypothetical protein
MNLFLTHEQAEELLGLLVLGLRDLTHEIAATDNAQYRSSLLERRQCLTDVADILSRMVVLPETATDTGEALERDLERELARPGD